MNTPLLSLIYAAVLHIGGLISVVVLMATGHLDQATGYPLLAFLLGFGIAVPVVLPALASTPSPAAAAPAASPPAPSPTP